jgi:hypothetical protein
MLLTGRSTSASQHAAAAAAGLRLCWTDEEPQLLAGLFCKAAAVVQKVQYASEALRA